MGIFDHTSIDLICPGCGHKTPKTIGWLKREPDSFDCSGCGETVALDFEEPGGLADALNEVDDALSDLGDTIDDINKGL